MLIKRLLAFQVALFPLSPSIVYALRGLGKCLLTYWQVFVQRNYLTMQPQNFFCCILYGF